MSPKLQVRLRKVKQVCRHTRSQQEGRWRGGEGENKNKHAVPSTMLLQDVLPSLTVEPQNCRVTKSTNSHKDRKRSKWQRFVISKVLFVELCSLVDLLLLPAMTEIHAHIQTARPPQSLVTTWPSKYRLMKYLKRPSSFRKY